jgi:hypothetical protein
MVEGQGDLPRLSSEDFLLAVVMLAEINVLTTHAGPRMPK